MTLYSWFNNTVSKKEDTSNLNDKENILKKRPKDEMWPIASVRESSLMKNTVKIDIETKQPLISVPQLDTKSS